MKILKKKVEEILDLADVKINGNRAWDIQVHNDGFYRRVLSQGSLGFGESYMDGWWSCESIDELFCKLLKSNIQDKVKPFSLFLGNIKAKLMNLQKISKAFNIGKYHYDLGNDFYKHMLDKRLVYTCGYWENSKDLDKAQEAKLDLVCRKMGLKPGMNVLDIGCGWGSFLKYAAEKYKVKGVGVTVSEEQVKLGNESCKGFDIEIRLQDYRDINEKEKFDRIVSLGMFEHVGTKNYKKFMEIVYKNLKDNGLFLLHTIGGNESVVKTEPWIDKYIFPGGVIPSVKQIAESAEGCFILEDWHNFGTDYDKTLMAWYKNFKSNWKEIKKIDEKYDEKFYRMWTYYLLSTAGSFRARHNHLWQIVFSKQGSDVAYKSVR
tara:strand:+ start:1786 stop:2913 length:1128 start_codon:yes stop_codon:yes gene_type:complete